MIADYKDSETNKKQLTKSLVLAKTKANNLENVRSLNLWGNQLQSLQILRDEMKNLQIISLSVNNINTLYWFENCFKLQELYLRKNVIQDTREVIYLKQLNKLKVIWLHDNPCANTQDYRAIVIQNVPSLLKLDNDIITQDERQISQRVYCNLQNYSLESKEKRSDNQKLKLDLQKRQNNEHKNIRNKLMNKKNPETSKQWMLSKTKNQNQLQQQNKQSIKLQNKKYSHPLINQNIFTQEELQFNKIKKHKQKFNKNNKQQQELTQQQINKKLTQQQINYKQQQKQQKQIQQQQQKQQKQIYQQQYDIINKPKQINQKKQRYQNILTSILILIKQLDHISLELLQQQLNEHIRNVN